MDFWQFANLCEDQPRDYGKQCKIISFFRKTKKLVYATLFIYNKLFLKKFFFMEDLQKVDEK